MIMSLEYAMNCIKHYFGGITMQLDYDRKTSWQCSGIVKNGKKKTILVVACHQTKDCADILVLSGPNQKKVLMDAVLTITKDDITSIRAYFNL